MKQTATISLTFLSSVQYILQFRKNLATEEGTYELISETLRPHNDKLIVGDSFCVLAKALFCIHHDILLSKLNFYGMTGTVYEWIKSLIGNMYWSDDKNYKF